MKKYAVIVAGGSGQRMGSAVPKQFLLLHGKPVLWHSVAAFKNAFPDIHIILVVPPSHTDHEFVLSLKQEGATVITGGDTRFHSVQNGLAPVPDEAVVFIHDGVRCLLSRQLIERCYDQAVAKGSAIPAIPATDSLRLEKDGAHAVIERSQIRIIQTPQTFIAKEIKTAFSQSYSDAFTDEATVMEASGKEVYLVEGDYENIKITRPLDLAIATIILQNRNSQP